MVREAQSGIDVQLKRRHDLIPNIVDAVRGYSGYERKLLENITSLRVQSAGLPLNKDKAVLENNISQGLKTIFALAENYPDLKAAGNFLDLHKALAETEDNIQMARRYYNGTVRDYNIRVESFPGNIVAALMKFKNEAFFEIEYATERINPDVKLTEG